jgi:hypothetical protein
MVRDFGVNDIDLHFGIYAAVLILSLLLVPMWALSNLDNFCAWPKGKHWLVRLLYAAAIGFLVFLLIAMAAVLLDEITDQIVKSML